MPKKKSYQENPSREANIVIGGGVGVLLGGLLLGFPGALVGGGIGAVLGSERGDTRRRLENPKAAGEIRVNHYSASYRIDDRSTGSSPYIFAKTEAAALRYVKRLYPKASDIRIRLIGPVSVRRSMVSR